MPAGAFYAYPNMRGPHSTRAASKLRLSSPIDCSKRPAWRWFRAKRSAPTITSASPTRLPCRNWSAVSTGSRSSVKKLVEKALTADHRFTKKSGARRLPNPGIGIPRPAYRRSLVSGLGSVPLLVKVPVYLGQVFWGRFIRVTITPGCMRIRAEKRKCGTSCVRSRVRRWRPGCARRSRPSGCGKPRSAARLRNCSTGSPRGRATISYPGGYDSRDWRRAGPLRSDNSLRM